MHIAQSANKISIPRKRSATINETENSQTGKSDVQQNRRRKSMTQWACSPKIKLTLVLLLHHNLSSCKGSIRTYNKKDRREESEDGGSVLCSEGKPIDCLQHSTMIRRATGNRCPPMRSVIACPALHQPDFRPFLCRQRKQSFHGCRQQVDFFLLNKIPNYYSANRQPCCHV